MYQQRDPMLIQIGKRVMRSRTKNSGRDFAIKYSIVACKRPHSLLPYSTRIKSSGLFWDLQGWMIHCALNLRALVEIPLHQDHLHVPPNLPFLELELKNVDFL